jgi:hypothetical protein
MEKFSIGHGIVTQIEKGILRMRSVLGEEFGYPMKKFQKTISGNENFLEGRHFNQSLVVTRLAGARLAPQL